jgi:hypothetical protein
MCAIKSFRINMHASVDSKGLSWTLSHLESAFTKKRGEGYGEMKTLSPPANNPSAPSNAAHQSLKTKTAPLESLRDDATWVRLVGQCSSGAFAERGGGLKYEIRDLLRMRDFFQMLIVIAWMRFIFGLSGLPASSER